MPSQSGKILNWIRILIDKGKALQELITEIPFNTPGKLYRSPMPFGPYDRLSQIWPLYQEKAIAVVVILVEAQEYLVRSQRDLPAFYRSQGLQVIHLPIRDFQTPDDLLQFEQALKTAANLLTSGKNLAVHCMAGIGRTGIFLASLGKRQLGLDGDQAITWIRQSIPDALENPLQEQFVINFGVA